MREDIISRERVDAFAELISQGLRVFEVTARMGITKGQAASLMRLLRRELGWQAV